MAFCDELRAVSAGIWQRELEHPFVQGLGNGSLDPAKFRTYLAQDYLFLIDYAKVFALAVSKAHDPATMAYFAKLCADTLNEEMALHRSYCAEFGITPADLEREPPAQTTRGYGGHLLRAAVSGGIAEIICAVLPCQWGYAEVAAHLKARGLPPEPRYVKWIEMYASPEFADYGRWLRETLEGLATRLGPTERERLKDIFHTSSRWEYLFWDMAWNQDTWAVPAD